MIDRAEDADDDDVSIDDFDDDFDEDFEDEVEGEYEIEEGFGPQEADYDELWEQKT